nr:DUF932 domain-containing protein [Micromonospora kangleipakensis]
MDWEQLQYIAGQLWPLTDDDGESAYLKKMARERSLRHLFDEADTQAAIRGTAWAGYQAITEWLDHEQPARSAHHRAHKVLSDGAAAAIKRRAFTLLSA